MKHFNRFKHNIRQENSHLPDGLGWEDMREGIFKKIEENSVPVQKSTTITTTLNKILLGTILILGVSLLSFLYLQKESNSSAPQINELNTKNEDVANKINLSKEFPTQNINEKVKIVNNSQLLSHQKSTLSSQDTNPAIRRNEKFDDSNNSHKTKTIKYQSNAEIEKLAETNHAKKKPVDKLIHTPYQHIAKSIQSQSNDVNTSSTENKQEKTKETTKNSNQHLVNSRSSQTQNNLGIDNINSKINNPKETNISVESVEIVDNNKHLQQIASIKRMWSQPISSLKTQKHTYPNLNFTSHILPVHQNLWSIEFGSGWNLWGNGINNSQIENNIYKNTNPDYGFSFSAHLNRRLNDKMHITTGLDIDFIYNKLKVRYTDLQDRKLEDVKISYITNVISGQKIYTFGDTIVVDTIIRSLTNFNKYQVITIPLILTYKVYNSTNWNVDIGIGSSVSFLTNYNGKYLQDNELKKYNKASNLYHTSPKLALNVSLGIKKRVIGSFYLGARLDYKHHLSNWGSQIGAGLKPNVMSGLIVVGMDL